MSRQRLKLLTAVLLIGAALCWPQTSAFAHATLSAPPHTTATHFTATITGLVLDDVSHQPIIGAQVFVAGTRIGTITDNSGRYRLANVPAGRTVLRVVMLGYSAAEQTVNLQDGQTANVDFTLGQSALSLDAVVVTGTPGGTRVRAIGNAIARIDADKIAQISPAVNVQQMLGQRTPGVMVLPNSGMVGTGSAVRIRGASSLSLTNQPIIYVDGVRVDNNPSAGPNIRQGRHAARLNDFNAEDIESMEIIKGPAAATLYGTEASNGVIQIITKRGKIGKPLLNITLKQGTNFMPNPAGRMRYTYGTNPTTLKVDSFNIIDYYKQQTGRDVFTNGPLQSVNASLSGGTEQARYFVSADHLSNTGLVDYNWVHSNAGRANLSLLPTKNWQLDAHADFVQNETRFAQAAEGFGIWEMLVYSSPNLRSGATNGFRYANPDVAASIDSRSKVNRFTGGLDLRNNPTTWFTHQLKAGIDQGATANQILFPRVPDGQTNFVGGRGTGEKTLENVSTTYFTVDYAATAKAEIRNMSTASSFGLQYYRKQFSLASEVGKNFPTTDVTTIGGAATTSAGEDYTENKTLGMYLQEQLGWKNRVFVTGAVRGDANSAFGKDFKAAYYPKLSGTWVINEEPFWHFQRINTLRLRGAWGQAGQQPDVFDAVTLYTPTTGPGDIPVLTPGSLGNTKLKPERGEELELGFDAGFLNDRLTTTFTFYNRITKDAIVRQQVQPSVGFPGARVVNLGRVKNWGTELGLNAKVIDARRIGWEIGVNYATAHNRIESLGGLGNILVANSTDQEHREGFPVGSFFWYKVVHAEFGAGGKLTNVLCDGGDAANHAAVPCASAPKVYWGQPTPRWFGSVSNDITILKNVRLYALVDFQGGMMFEDGEIQAGHQNFQNTFMSNPVTDPIFAAYQSVVPRAPLGFFNAGFAKLRELSATYTLPVGTSKRFGASNAAITGAWRNVAILWQAQKDVWGTKIFDPEIRPPGSELIARYQTTIPPASQIVFTMRLTY